jgi:hypothetical protein
MVQLDLRPRLGTGLHGHLQQVAADGGDEVVGEQRAGGAVGQQHHREAPVRHDAEERPLAEGVAVLAEAGQAVPPADRPAQGLLLVGEGRLDLRLGHGLDRAHGEQLGPVERDPAGHVEAGEGQDLLGGGQDPTHRAVGAGQRPAPHRYRLAPRDLLVTHGDPVH